MSQAQANVQRYKVQIRGLVQDIGFRIFVKNAATSFGISGRVCNDHIDKNLVHIVCESTPSAINDFLEYVRTRAAKVGAIIEDVKKEKAADDTYMRPLFYIEPDAEEERERKLDVGIEILKGIKDDTGILPKMLSDIKSDTKDIKSDTKALPEMSATLSDMRSLLKKMAEK